ncbi:putative 25S rRNA (Uridine(2843)-N(3))-methyltransferase [Seiridium cardinale]|uniref:25S rRNA (Uridine(2843)-N(3))-methyltransferase n=1 Tax=Seiridium cardinale TaxID=138064 RepID=A0ABR2Y6T8_9PEZI
MPPSKQRKGTNKRAERTLMSTKTSKPSAAKPSQERPTAEEPTKPAPSPQELASQQKILGTFQSAFSDVLSSSDFPQTLQDVKSALYDRDFGRAFGREDYLEVYAARWSPTRALGYASVLEGLREWLSGLILDQDSEDVSPKTSSSAGANEGLSSTAERIEELSLSKTESSSQRVEDGKDEATPGIEDDHEAAVAPAAKTLKLLALGGGAAELAAFASFLSNTDTRGDIILLDTGPWGGVVSKLNAALATPPPIYKYASAAAKAANTPIITPFLFRPTFHQQDILEFSPENLKDTVGSKPLLVTLLFTLNELYTSGGIGKTTSFLRSLGKLIPAGSLLLVVDSPGSYSEALVGKGGGGKEEKKYPMSWLLDHTLLRNGERDRKPKRPENEATNGEVQSERNKTEKEPKEGCKWEKLEENDSVWFRLADELRYPIQLENMRYQIHLYRAIDMEDADK